MSKYRYTLLSHWHFKHEELVVKTSPSIRCKEWKAWTSVSLSVPHFCDRVYNPILSEANMTVSPSNELSHCCYHTAGHALNREDTDWCEKSVDLLKLSIMTVPILSLHDSTQTFLIHTDVCDLSLGVALMQKDADGREAAAVYGS